VMTVPGAQRNVMLNGAKTAVVTAIDRTGMESEPVIVGLIGIVTNSR
jgi:hypothetical protein